ncbi:hypothetical protein TNCT_449031 [Trichonephila clavata]|uniref:Uncharacterized protein n=1 Tax=Trichonephila clavata TaxID=2740835 RepID=A0A8X6J031_TRICU|nr:hypothetical protein TNCT_449031 [Trichonephila clavata]
MMIHIRKCIVSMSAISQRSHLMESEAWRVDSQLERGQTQAEVAEIIGVSQDVISRIWKRLLWTRNASHQGKVVHLQQSSMKIDI